MKYAHAQTIFNGIFSTSCTIFLYHLNVKDSLFLLIQLHSRQAEQPSHVSTSGHSSASGSGQNREHLEEHQQGFVDVDEQEDHEYEHRDG